MSHFRAVVYPNTTKSFTLDFHKESNKDAVLHIRSETGDDGVYFNLTKQDETGNFVKV